MRKMKPDMTWGGWTCPTNEKHGTLVMLPNGSYHCPHSDHTCKSVGEVNAKEFTFSREQVER